MSAAESFEVCGGGGFRSRRPPASRVPGGWSASVVAADQFPVIDPQEPIGGVRPAPERVGMGA